MKEVSRLRRILHFFAGTLYIQGRERTLSCIKTLDCLWSVCKSGSFVLDALLILLHGMYVFSQ